MNEFPPLPPYDDTRHSQLGGVTQYSPEDMHAYGKACYLAALEEAAKLFNQPHREYFGDNIQDDIRALKEQIDD